MRDVGRINIFDRWTHDTTKHPAVFNFSGRHRKVRSTVN